MGKIAACMMALLTSTLAMAAVEARIAISDPQGGKSGHPEMAFNSVNNNYLVLWLNRSDAKLYSRVVKPGGAVQGNPTAISSKPAGEGYGVAFDSVHKVFLVVYEQKTSGAAANILWAQRVSTLGAPVGNPVNLAAETKKLNWHPAVVFNESDEVFFVAWSKEGLTSADGGNFSATTDGIYGRFVDSDGKRIGDEILIQKMAYQSSGGYLWHLGWMGFDVAWNSTHNNYGLVATHVTQAGEGATRETDFINISSAGAMLGKLIRINKTAVGYYSVHAAIAYNPAMDQYLTAWESITHPERFYVGRIYSRVIGQAGAGVTNEFLTFANDQQNAWPSLAYDSTKGDFLLVWDSDSNLDKTLVNWDVVGQFIAANGTMNGKYFKIAGTATDEAEHAVAYDAAIGNYLVAFAQIVDATKISIGGTILGAH